MAGRSADLGEGRRTMTAVAPQEVVDDVGRRPSRAALVPAALAVLIVGLVAGLLLGRGMGVPASAPTNAVDLGFARDMTTHHAQAVEMSEIVHRRSTDPAVNYLAFDVLSTQQGQIGIMTGWLDLWREPQSSSDPAMLWMGHVQNGPMPGMATDDEIQGLNTLPLADMTEQYLRLMIRHHRGAIAMAQFAAENAGTSDIATLADNMDAGQSSEIRLMQDMLVERGWQSEPDSEPVSGH
jgi:uncharacterized protein (DUF305 family)